MRRFITWPAKNLGLVVPTLLVLGLLVGSQVDVTGWSAVILPATMLMVYPSVIALPWRTLLSGSLSPVMGWALAVNFLAVPLLAYALGSVFLRENPAYFAGLAVIALIPTSGMTISWTALFGGNTAAAVRLCVMGLVLAALLAPWYLLVMVGQLVVVDATAVFRSIGLVVALPLLLGFLTQRLLVSHYGREGFDRQLKPILPAISAWFMMVVIFVSISLRAEAIMAGPGDLLLLLGILAAFYVFIFVIGTVIGRRLEPGDAVALVYGTAMRHLSIGVGVAATAFGPPAALMVTLAFLIQQQAAVLYGKWHPFNTQEGSPPR